jgi:6-phosphogluconolactonase
MKLTRRILAVALLLVAVVAPESAQTRERKSAKKNCLAFVGTYTNKTASKGIYAFRYDAGSGKLTPLGVAAETPDPSWVAVHPNGKFLYAANEAGKNSMVSAFALDAQSGKLTLLNQVPALGEDPCYLSFDKTGKYLFVANYTSGNVVVFPIGTDGKLGAATANVRDEGKLGPNKERQDGPHAHWVGASKGNHFVYVADLGLDKVLVYKFDATKGSLAPADAAETTPGTGPRHLAFSSDGKFLYVLGELQSTVTVFSNDTETFRLLQTAPMLPTGFSGRNDASEIEIHPNGKFLYSANRGQDTIVVYRIGGDWSKNGDLTFAPGALAQAAYVPTGGKEPRHFAIDPAGNFLLAEDQLSDKIVTFRIDPKTGALTPTGDTVEVPSPVCLVFLPVE